MIKARPSSNYDLFVINRGEKAYCSTECRGRQIVMDDNREKKWGSQASSRSTVADLSTSPCSTSDRQMFTTGIFAI